MLSKRPTCWKCSPYDVGRGDGANGSFALLILVCVKLPR